MQILPVQFFSYKRIFFFLLPLLITFTHFIFFFKPNLYLVPNKGGFKVSYYTDNNDGGNSEIFKLLSDRKGLQFQYQLNTLSPYPFAGISIQSAENKYLNLKGYDYIHVSLMDEGSRNLKFQIIAFDKKITIQNNLLTHVFYLQDCFVRDTGETYDFPLKSFLIPAWWLNRNSISDESAIKKDFSKVLAFEIESGFKSPVGKEIGFTMSEFSIRQNPLSFFLNLFYTLLIYYFFACSIYFVLKRKVLLETGSDDLTCPAVSTYGKIGTESEINKITNYLARQYSDPELNLTKTAMEFGIHPVKVGNILKQNFKVNFKTYLNRIRIAEAKRRLISTDRSISEIALSVGFSNVTHFNRVFKELEKLPPKDFRKKYYGRG